MSLRMSAPSQENAESRPDARDSRGISDGKEPEVIQGWLRRFLNEDSGHCGLYICDSVWTILQRVCGELRVSMLNEVRTPGLKQEEHRCSGLSTLTRM